MKRFISVFSILLTLHLLAPPAVALNAPTEEITQARANLVQINAQLATLESFVSRNDDGTQRFDARAARGKRHNPTLIALAKEIVQFQNNMQRHHAVRKLLGTEEFKYLTALFADAERVKEAQKMSPNSDRTLDVTRAHPCGDFAHPVPKTEPKRTLVGPVPNAVENLIDEGFHVTAGYVCGRVESDCIYDFTRPRTVMFTQYGMCSKGAMRDQATLDSAYTSPKGQYYWYQEGEPNPEFTEHAWPYWYWGAYTFWWHTAFK